jgi:hypothetical protein
MIKLPGGKRIYTMHELARSANTVDILDQIADLIKQATTERSHYYTASVLLLARDEIIRLRRLLREPTAG